MKQGLSCITLVRPAEKVAWGGFRGYFADPDGAITPSCPWMNRAMSGCPPDPLHEERYP